MKKGRKFVSAMFVKSACVFIQNEYGLQEKYELTYRVLLHDNVYSLLVVMLDSYGLNDSVFLYDIARDESSACEIVEVLSKNTVTPCTAGAILEDLFAELNFHHTH
jgi:hypothetical protein